MEFFYIIFIWLCSLSIIEGENNFNPVTLGEINYHLYTTATRYAPTIIAGGDSIPADSLEPDKEVKVFIGGLFTKSDDPIDVDMKETFFTTGTSNYIFVDWSKYANQLLAFIYISVETQIAEVAQCVADMLEKISIESRIPFEKFHLIGHSLGAHISGLVGQVMKSKPLPRIVSRITGLDPAILPFTNFDGSDISKRLSRDDATFVEVIHTSIIGLQIPLGHYDYYPNGGIFQPGCTFLVVCEHLRAIEYFIESVLNNQFMAFKCDSIDNLDTCVDNTQNKMDDYPNPFDNGNYYLRTREASPYGCGISTRC